MTTQSFFTACVLLLTGAGLYFAPAGIAERIRGSVNDLMGPGLQFVRLTRDSVETRIARLQAFASDDGSKERLAEELEIERERNRALQIQLSELNEQTRIESDLASTFSKTPRLFLPTLVEVAVLGSTLADDWCSGKLIDFGAKGGLRENELVLASRKSKRTLIDAGQDAEISTEDSLLLGRSVIGKVEHVGRWTSTIQLVTDANYRGRAQLIRKTSEGFVFDGARGILKGRGEPLCKLEGIPADSSVHVHDSVFTADREGMEPTPLYYGEVVQATLEADDREWTVYVKPAPLPTRLTKVNVLRMVANPERLAVK